MRNRPMRAIIAVVTVVAALGALGSLRAGSASALTRTTVLREAAGYANANGYDAGIAVLDTKTGELDTSGQADYGFVSASVVKVLIATRLLLDGEMDGRVAYLAWRMITLSDNDATDMLYPMVGRRGLVPWLARHYHLSGLGTPPTSRTAWGYTRLVPRGLARFYAKVKRDPSVSPWLLNAMHHARKRSYVGEYQFWGLPSATIHAAVKQGWNISSDHANVNTTGFVNGDRYAVVIMTRGPTRTYLRPITRMITHLARLLLPDGHFPSPTPSLSSMSRTAGRSAGGTALVLHGAAFTQVTGVLFGGYPGRNLAVTSSARLTVTTPAHSAGWVNIRVVTTHGNSPITKVSKFHFIPPPSVSSIAPPGGPPEGGTTLTVTGTSFVDVTTVLIGDTPATSTISAGRTQLTVVTPPHAAGVVDVRIITEYGESAVVAADNFAYDSPPLARAKAAAR